MNKAEVRISYQLKRQNLSAVQIQTYSDNISKNLFENFSFRERKISVFLTISDKKEINTTQIIQKLLEQKNRLIVSQSDFKTKEMNLFIYENEAQIAITKYGIPEPQYGKRIDAKEVDVVLVPLLAFDEKGYRVGFGGGFYDRFLGSCRKDCLFIGLNFFEAIQQIDDINNFDIPLDYCITPRKVYKFL